MADLSGYKPPVYNGYARVTEALSDLEDKYRPKVPLNTKLEGRNLPVQEQYDRLLGGAKPAIDKRMVESPSHYRTGKVEVIDYIEQIVTAYRQHPDVGYNIGAALKYLSRAPYKGAMAQDIAKAQWHINRALSKLVTDAATPKVERD
jgi:hypothetical protein